MKPPAGFEDSPRSCQRATNGKVFKKQEKRYRSEERWMLKAYNTRAKSEERLKETRDIRSFKILIIFGNLKLICFRT